MHHKRKADHRSLSRSTTTGRSPSSHVPGQFSRKKSKTDKISTSTKCSTTMEMKTETNANRLQQISGCNACSTSLKRTQSPDTLRSTPAFDTVTHTWAATKSAKPSGKTHIKTGVDCQVLDMAAIQKSATVVTPTSSSDPVTTDKSTKVYSSWSHFLLQNQ